MYIINKIIIADASSLQMFFFVFSQKHVPDVLTVAFPEEIHYKNFRKTL